MKEQVFRLIDHLFHMFASSYRDDAKNEANEVYYDYIEATTPAKPTAEELLQAWKGGCDMNCSLNQGEEKPFPCKCLCDVQHTKWNIPEILKIFNERAK